MSTEPRGRHRAARHAAPKKKSTSGKQIGAAFGLAGISSVVLTSGSTVSGIVQAGDLSVVENLPTKVVASGSGIAQIETASTVTRAQAASRSEDRKTLAETEILAQASVANNPVADVTAVIDATPTVSSTERKSLQALASTTDQLDSLITQAQDQKIQQAQLLISEQQAIENAKLQAEAEVQAALLEAERIRRIGVIVVPIEGNYQLSARYGQRGNIWATGWHTGLDFRAKSGATVFAAANGTIISAGWGGAYGYRIEIDHGNGYVTSYNHLSKIELTSGDVVAGQEIGKSGSTGNTTGPHLHFEVTKDGFFENPTNWLWRN
jgi:murein DD-endopeptidase MepM/ murein hydrolase activator NlpD